MSVPVVSIWRKSDQYSARYDQKSDGAVMLSPHHKGAVGHIRLRKHANCSILPSVT